VNNQNHNTSYSDRQIVFPTTDGGRDQSSSKEDQPSLAKISGRNDREFSLAYKANVKSRGEAQKNGVLK
jgi:hypothetical protein